MVKHTYKFLKVCLTIYYVIFLYSFFASQGISLWTCLFFFLSGQKFQVLILFTSFAKYMGIGTLALLSIFNGEDNKMVF